MVVIMMMIVVRMPVSEVLRMKIMMFVMFRSHDCLLFYLCCSLKSFIFSCTNGNYYLPPVPAWAVSFGASAGLACAAP